MRGAARRRHDPGSTLSLGRLTLVVGGLAVALCAPGCRTRLPPDATPDGGPADLAQPTCVPHDQTESDQGWIGQALIACAAPPEGTQVCVKVTVDENGLAVGVESATPLTPAIDDCVAAHLKGTCLSTLRATTTAICAIGA